MKNKILAILIKALSGNATKEELILLEKWEGKSHEHLEEVRVMKDLWRTKFCYPGIVNSEEEFANLWDSVHSKKSKSKQIKLVFDWQIGLKIAGAILVFISVVFLFYYGEFNSTPVINEVSQVTKSNPRGQKSKIYLEDGTWIWLNSSSRIEYSDTFKGHNERLLSLSGEAYFEVAKDSLRPFIIYSDPIVVEVLGTMFNVKTNNEGHVSIALIEGSVKVNWNNNQGDVREKILLPGELLSIDNDSRLAILEAYNPTDVMGWKDGILYFDDASLEQVKRKLQTWYDVDIIVVGSPSSQWSYSGEFDNFVLDNVLEAMSFAEDFKYEIEGDDVKIMFN